MRDQRCGNLQRHGRPFGFQHVHQNQLSGRKAEPQQPQFDRLEKRFGIVLHATAVGAVINGGADFATGSFGAINHFAVGIENDAPGALIADFAVDVNDVGVVNTAPGAFRALFDASGNGGAGAVVTLAVPASVSLINFRAFNNGGDGVDLSGLGGGKIASLDVQNNLGQGVSLQNSIGTIVQSATISGNGAAGIFARRVSKATFVGFNADANKQGGVIIQNSSSSTVESFNPTAAVSECCLMVVRGLRSSARSLTVTRASASR
jgi:parallel beta-helix repeat protein